MEYHFAEIFITDTLLPVELKLLSNIAEKKTAQSLRDPPQYLSREHYLKSWDIAFDNPFNECTRPDFTPSHHIMPVLHATQFALCVFLQF